MNATGPRLDFAATPGLGPDANSTSVCTHDHAGHAAKALAASIERMRQHGARRRSRQGIRQTLVIGVGNGLCTCEGAAFEYTFNVEFTLRQAGVRDLHEGRRGLHAEAVRAVARGGQPRTYQSPAYSRLFAIGIAFAPPHPISRCHGRARGARPSRPRRRARACPRR